MPEFWHSSGYRLVEVDAEGRLRPTDDFLRAFVLRPEMLPVAESCAAEFALHEATRVTKAREQRFGDRGAEAESFCELVDREWTVCARKSLREVAGGIANRLEQLWRQTWWQPGAQRIAITCGIFYGDVALLGRNLERDDAPRSFEIVDPAFGVGHRGTRDDFFATQIADAQQQIVNAVGRLHAPAFFEVLQLLLHSFERSWIEQLAQLCIPEQFTKLRLIDRKRLRAPLCERRLNGSTTRRPSSPSITPPASSATAAFAGVTRCSPTRSSAAAARATRRASPSTSTAPWETVPASPAVSAPRSARRARLGLPRALRRNPGSPDRAHQRRQLLRHRRPRHRLACVGSIS